MLWGKLPPFLQLLVEGAKLPGRHPAPDGIGRDVFIDDGPGRNDNIIPYFHIIENFNVCSDEYIVSDFNASYFSIYLWPSFLPFSIKCVTSCGMNSTPDAIHTLFPMLISFA